MGLPIDDEYLFPLNFADDQVIFAQDTYDLEFMLQRLYRKYEKYGMRINIAKIEYLTVNSEDKYEIFIAEDEPIKQ